MTDERPTTDPALPDEPPPGEGRSVEWFADYVYGSISTLVTVAGMTFETHPSALVNSGIVIVGAVAIWFAHALSRLITQRAWRHLEVGPAAVVHELEGSWPIVSASLPATFFFLLAGVHVVHSTTAFVLANVVGVLALAVVGIGTAGGAEHPPMKRALYVVGLVSVGLAIVALESVVHLL